jgi:phenylalanyl-tRNA synthetase beta chain
MNILTAWLRQYLPTLSVSDRQLADDLTLRGIAVEGVHDLGSGNGSLFEMDITTNRVDAMNHYGIAREAATIYDLPLQRLEASLPAAQPGPAFRVEIQAPELCGRFTARVLRGVTIASSAGQIADYFSRLGLKAISNAVDASNFVLHGMGHPTHAFDLDKIEGGIVIRLAREGERLKLLDGTERTLEPDDLVIADHVKALSLAGVMGGWDSMITPDTKNILVEAAWFDPVTIRRSSRRHLLHTDASHRFERGADFNACATANALVSKLILQSGGSVHGQFTDVVIPQQRARTAERAPISLSIREVQRHLGRTVEDTASGSALTADRVQRYLTSLGCQLAANGSDSFSAELPSWRLDLEREIDLIEEVARVYGYNRFADTLPTALPIEAHPLDAKEAAVRSRLLALGYSEAISSSFASAAEGSSLGPQRGSVALENPLSEEAGILRPSLLPGMLGMLAYNLNRDVRDVRLFEKGTVFTGSTAHVQEFQSLAIGNTGSPRANSLHSSKDAGIFELKGAIESVLSLFAASPDDLASSASAAAAYSTSTPTWIEPGRGAIASLNGREIAWFGEVASSERDARKLRQPVYVAEVDVQALYALPLRRATAREISRYQAVERDFSFTFADSVHWDTIERTVRALKIPELTRLTPVEIFRDPKAATVPAGHYALLSRCTFQSPERTLREDELSRWSSQIIAALTGLGGVLRA